jgi:hypothetical protein
VLPGENEGSAKPGEANLYEWHQSLGATGIRFIATLVNNESDEYDWRDFYKRSEGYPKSAAVAGSGVKVLFSSLAQLTSYDNAKNNELYLYDATKPVSAGNPVCVSCNPAGTPATHNAYFDQASASASSPLIASVFVSRNLSADGSRVFFDTEETLVPQDTNGVMNVYEWEQEGTGSCTVGDGSSSGGCLYLISTGQSGSGSYFGEASTDGRDVFFFTRQTLVSQDQDNNVDVYDAREDGGIVAQNPAPTAAACSGEACRGALGPTAVFAAPTSAGLTGAGNISPQSPATPAGRAKPRPLTRAQKLADALHACRRRPKVRRAKCEAQARKSYGARNAKSDRRGK